MNALKSWTMIIIFASVASVILEVLSPSGKTEKIMRFVLGAFLIFTMLLPLKSFFKNINLDTSEKKQFINKSDDLNEKIAEQRKEMAKENLQQMIKNELEQNQIKVQKIKIFMDTTKDNSILINKVEIYLNDSECEKRGEAKKLIKDTMGINAEVLIGSD